MRLFGPPLLPRLRVPLLLLLLLLLLLRLLRLLPLLLLRRRLLRCVSPARVVRAAAAVLSLAVGAQRVERHRDRATASVAPRWRDAR